MHYDIPAAAAYEMSTSTAYQERKCQDAHALRWNIQIEPRPDGAHVRIERTLPTAGFPRMLRTLMPAGVSATETVTWGAVERDGSRTARLAVDFHRSSADLIGTIRIIPDGPVASIVVVDAVFRAHVPLLGAKLERAAAPIVAGVIDAEEATGKAWVRGLR